MNNSPTILFLLGNRDLQIRAEHAPHPVIERYFITQNDGEDLVINKAQDAGFRFNEAAQNTLQAYPEISPSVVFPMIQATLDHLAFTEPRLIFVASQQQPAHHQDTYSFAAFAARYYADRGYATDVRIFKQNPNDFGGLVEYFTELFEQIDAKPGQFYLSNSGGTPNMRAASHFSGVFRGFTYLHVNSFSQQIVESTFQRQEQLILRQIIESKLEMYDYEGIALLPVSESIREVCRTATNFYNLNTPYITEETGYEARALRGLELIYQNLLVCYRKGAFAETVQRIVRIEEAVGQLLLFRLLQQHGLLDAEEQILSSQSKLNGESIPFERVLSDRNEKAALVSLHFHHALGFDLQDGGQVVPVFRFQHQRPVPLQAVVGGRPFYYFLFRSLGQHNEIWDFWQHLNSDYAPHNNRLAYLRNFSLAGHGFSGVSRQDIDELTGKFELFTNHLLEQLEQLAGRRLHSIFELFNQQIRDQL
jgi:hypothetical protein